MSDPSTRYTLRALPLPAKFVVTLFMLTVGLGYFSALVQMHFQHTPGDGTPMPGLNDVIEIFAGKRWITREEAETQRPKSKLETLVTATRESWGATTGMSAAFFQKDPTKEYQKLTAERKGNPELQAKLDAEREGERKIVAQWILLPDVERKAAYDADRFVPNADAPTSITARFLHGNAITEGVKVKSILSVRCADCHQEGGSKSEFPLDTYVGLAKYLDVPPGIAIPDGASGAWCVSSRQIGREKLAQSTHAHLLSFAMLFALTGLVFAFTSYPGLIRGVLAPIVLLAQVADVSCWWLARIEGPGIYFAQAIIGTGAVVGLGLAAQIVLSVFDLYGTKGRLVLVLLFAGAAAGGGVIAEKYAKPYLAEQKAKKEQAEADAKKKPADATPVKVDPKETPNGTPKLPAMPPSHLETLLTGEYDAMAKFNGQDPGGMIRAFFDKDEAFKKANPAPGSDLFEQRKSEQALVVAWTQADPQKRKASYQVDKFPLTTALKGRRFTPEFMADDQNAKIKSLIDARCGKCHAPEKKQEDYPLTNYQELFEYLKPDAK